MGQKHDMSGADEESGIIIYKPGALEVDGQLISHNVWVDGRRTSVRLEAVMWEALHEISEREAKTIHEVISYVAKRQHANASLTATVRAFLLAYYKSVARDPSFRIN